MVERKGGHESQLRRHCSRRRIGQHQRRMKIAGRRDPGPAAPSAPPALLLRDNPKRPALPCFGKAKRFRIGGVHEVEEFHRRACRQIGFHWYVIASPDLIRGLTRQSISPSLPSPASGGG